jgi:hypothetical protein
MGGEGNTLAPILKTVINWTGFNGGPGYTNLYWQGIPQNATELIHAQDAVDKTDLFCATLATRVPTTVRLAVDPTVQVIEETTGMLQGFANTDPDPQRTGSGTGNYSAASGACVNWTTQGVRNGRRIRGRTFIVPLAGSSLDVDGSINGTQLTALRNAAEAMRLPGTSAQLLVWARPTGPGATDGISYPVSGSSISDKAAILTSRRD